MANIPKKVAERFIKEVGRFQALLRKAKDRDINEADTGTIVTDILGRVFGYDKYSEVTREYAIRGRYCDLAIEIEGEIKYLIEVKAIGLDLKENHLRQATTYGAEKGVQWVALTNGIVWHVYKVRFERPIGVELVCSFNFLELNPRKREDQDRLFVLCKKGVRRAAIEEFHQHVQTVNKFVLGALVLSDPVLSVIRRELRRIPPGVKVDSDEIETILVNDVLKREVVEGEAAKDAAARVKKASAKLLRERKSTRKSERRKTPRVVQE